MKLLAFDTSTELISIAVTRPVGVDGFHTKPRFTADGQALLALVEGSRVTHVSRIDLATGATTPLTGGPRFDYDFDAAANGRVAVLGGDSMHPYRIEAASEGSVPLAAKPAKGTDPGLRLIADHNTALDRSAALTAERDRLTAELAAAETAS